MLESTSTHSFSLICKCMRSATKIMVWGIRYGEVNLCLNARPLGHSSDIHRRIALEARSLGRHSIGWVGSDIPFDLRGCSLDQLGNCCSQRRPVSRYHAIHPMKKKSEIKWYTLETATCGMPSCAARRRGLVQYSSRNLDLCGSRTDPASSKLFIALVLQTFKTSVASSMSSFVSTTTIGTTAGW